ncbi:hypothetical protein R5R35_004016 [Gryllus longicercus]|uniref:Neurobeachin n=1 Tax=Gryllus longicercus TaxID=2509291 RepID=A0AAN9VL61_9ORTH
MRIKLCPNHAFDSHMQASSLRDNAGPPGAWLWKTQQLPALEIPGAVRREAADDSPPDEDDLLSLMPDAQSEAGGGASAGGAPGGAAAPKDKPLVSESCELVTLMSRVTGRLEVTAALVSFRDTSPVQRGDAAPERMDFKFALSRLREIHLRRYNLRRSALEFFLTDQTNYFLNFSAKTRNKVFTRILALRPPNLSSFSSRSPGEMLRASGLTRKWVQREISNFEYLMHLNTLAGRTYSDLSQYPVFPWILADYTSERLDLDNPASFRDLARPVGVVNPRNEAEVRAKYDSFEDPSGTIAKFHYGTHYSNSAGVLHYLVRVEPFTSLHVELQSGRFDVADRQFHSLPATWRLLMDNPNDVKELTPEFFCFPEFLRNQNKFDLGLLQGTKERVDDVELPRWAHSAEDFIFQHRRALESEYVSAHLHEWIDLIFGYKQKGPKAVEALNVFYYCSYEGAVDLDAIADEKERLAVEGMINNFGQTPIQLLREPHPARLSSADFCARVLRGELRRAPFYAFLDHLRPTPVEVSSDKDPLVFLSAPRSPPRGFLQAGAHDSLVSVSRGGAVGAHTWAAAADRHAPARGFVFDVDPSLASAKTKRTLGNAHHPGQALSSQLFALSHDAKVLYTGGHWDCTLRLYSLAKGKTVAALRRHFDVVTCVALDAVGQYLVTGSRDCTAVVWELVPSGGGAGTAGSTAGAGSATAPLPRPHCTLYGHDRPVSCVCIATELDLVVTGSLDGTVNVHTIEEGQYLRTLEPQSVNGLDLEVSLLALSAQGDIAFAAHDKRSHSVHVYSVNGVSLGSKLVPGRVAGLAVAGDMLVVGDDAGDITISRLLGLPPVYDLPLHVPIQSVVVTAGATHLLVPLRDGRVMVLGVANA